ncbi:hypothetical protein BVIET440_40261 [Burkholderia vietnamiensis]|nr:hypothetical protein BVI2075_320224 [Burkholderia vietnamiensis]
MENLVESRPPGPVGWLTGWLAYKQTFVACSEAIERIPYPSEGESHVSSHCGRRRQSASRFVESRTGARRDFARARRFLVRVRRDRRVAAL